MIVRVVHMTFRQEKVGEFIELFNQSKEKIAGFEGCLYLELLRNLDSPYCFTTYSHWNSKQDLEKYRESELFGNVWQKTKVLFAEKPIAMSYSKQFSSSNS